MQYHFAVMKGIDILGIFKSHSDAYESLKETFSTSGFSILTDNGETYVIGGNQIFRIIKCEFHNSPTHL